MKEEGTLEGSDRATQHSVAARAERFPMQLLSTFALEHSVEVTYALPRGTFLRRYA